MSKKRESRREKEDHLLLLDEISAREVKDDDSMFSDDSSSESESLDLEEIVHVDLIGNLLIRFFSAPLIDDPFVKKIPDKKQEIPAFLQITLTQAEVHQVCAMAAESFLQQDPLLLIEKECLPLNVVSDLHGQLVQLLRIFRTCGSPQKESYLFLGDYVDRGVQGLEIIVLLFCLKIRYPSQIFLVRGNHEDANTTLNYGFFDECINRWPAPENSSEGVKYEAKKSGEKIWRSALGAFNSMPVAALVGGKIFCSHGGISPFIKSLADINKIVRPSIVPPYGAMCDLLWSDPSPINDGWALSHRGISFTYGVTVVEEFCRANNLDLIIRGHQINTEMYKSGYKMSLNCRLITIFSAPNYMNYKNNACIVTISAQMRIKFTVFRCRYYVSGKRNRKKRVAPKKKDGGVSPSPSESSLKGRSEKNDELSLRKKELSPEPSPHVTPTGSPKKSSKSKKDVSPEAAAKGK